MALESCRECGNMVSTEALSCPRCGAPYPTRTADDAAAATSEQEVYKARVHWIIYFWPVVVTAVLVLTLAIKGTPPWLRWGFFGLSAIAWLVAIVIAESMDFIVTSRRVTTRTGILNKNSQETLLEKVETVHIQQDLWGRILGYGTVTVVGTGGSHDVFKRISKPLQLRRMIHDQIDRRRGPAVRT